VAGPLHFTIALSDPSHPTESLEHVSADTYAYIFRDPNRGRDKNADDYTLTVGATDLAGKSTTLVIHFFVATNDLKLQTLQEERKRQ